MKRLIAILLTSCMIAGITTPTGSEFMMELKANTEAAMNNMSGTSHRTESASEGAGNFDRAIRDLYDNSMSVTDEEIIASAQKMDSDFAAIEKNVGEEAQSLIDYLKFYEAAKSRYIAGDDHKAADFATDIIAEWDRQGEFTSYVMPASDTIHTMVPRIKVTGCSTTGDSAVLDIYEWMTVGYAPEASDVINATAYGYNFSLVVDRDRDGSWNLISVSDTDQNFDWMNEEAEYAAKAEASGDYDMRVISEDGSKEMMAASAAKSYNYNVSAAIAYADKYCIDYNSSYNSYKGRGGDCANFVSQCLYAGGFQQDSVWYKHSVAWINVMKQIAHFKDYGNFMNASNSNLLRGNPIYFDWNGDGVYDHATICVGRNNSGTAILDSHTRDLYHATWTNWSFKKAATIQLRGSGSSSSTSDGGFKYDSTGKYYQYGDGTRIKGCFQTISGKTYYFKSDGYVAKGLTKIDGKTYIFNLSSGEMYTGWVTYKGKKYYLKSNGEAETEWAEIGSHTYYFDPVTCAMAKGFYKVKKKLHYFNSNGEEQFGWITVNGKKYYLDEWGVVQFGWHTVSGKKYYFDCNGVPVTGNVSIDGTIYKFDKNGVMQGKVAVGTTAADKTIVKGKYVSGGSTSGSSTSSQTSTAAKKTGKTGWEKKNGKWYDYKNGTLQSGWLKLGKNKERVFYLGTNGAMVTGWKTISGSKYYFNGEGLMQKGWVKLSGYWYYFDKNGKMKTGWLKLNNRYFYLQKDGKMKTGWLKDKGQDYYLNSEGVMVTGRQVIKGKVYYFANTGELLD